MDLQHRVNPVPSAPTCPTCGGPVRIVALANGDLGRRSEAPKGRFRCPKCGKTHPSRRSRAQHLRFCNPQAGTVPMDPRAI